MNYFLEKISPMTIKHCKRLPSSRSKEFMKCIRSYTIVEVKVYIPPCALQTKNSPFSNTQFLECKPCSTFGGHSYKFEVLQSTTCTGSLVSST